MLPEGGGQRAPLMQIRLIYFHTEPTVNINTLLTCDLFVMCKPSRTCICIFVFALFFRLGQVFKMYNMSPLIQFIK